MTAEESALRQVDMDYRTMQQRLSGGPSIARILEILSARAETHQLACEVVQPRAEESTPRVIAFGRELRLREVPLRVTLTGRYQDMGAFLGWFPEAPFAVAVQMLTVTPADDERTNIQADVVVAVYRTEAGQP